MSPNSISPDKSTKYDRPVRVLALCDTPTVRPPGIPAALQTTGFATVGKNIFREWTAAGVTVDIWALHFDGWGYDQVPWKLFPAGRDWATPTMLSAFLHQMCMGAPGGVAYTHVWILMNSEVFDGSNFCVQFKRLCQKYGIHSTIYFPIDADNPPGEWFEILNSVSEAVTFTEYGKREATKGLAKLKRQKDVEDGGADNFKPTGLKKVRVIPHGVDDSFGPRAGRRNLRENYLVPRLTGNGRRPFLEPGDFCIGVVAKNEWRKDILRSLEILKGLRNAGVPAKMILRTAPDGAKGCGGVPIEHAAEMLGLRANIDWTRMDAVDDEAMAQLYNSMDLLLFTTTGEGWGLPIVEALKCGTPVAMGRHTSCGEIGTKVNEFHHEDAAPVIWLLPETGFCMGYENRLRQRVDVAEAVKSIKAFYEKSAAHGFKRVELAPEIREWLSWKRIANEFLQLMGIPDYRSATASFSTAGQEICLGLVRSWNERYAARPGANKAVGTIKVNGYWYAPIDSADQQAELNKMEQVLNGLDGTTGILKYMSVEKAVCISMTARVHHASSVVWECTASESIKKNLRVEFDISVREKQTTKPKENNMLKLTSTQQSTVTAKFETAAGVVVPIVGTAQWAADPAVVKLTPAADGLSVLVEAVAPGKTTLTCTGEGDEVPGKDTVTNSLDIEVVNPEASQVVLEASEPVEKPAPEAAAASSTN